ncbi:MBL fold metallo-hydrolase [Actinomadura sp. GTD37]|uniref:MBL fold metallo-hydrolase n=1 Tax=Actinomadura sp. GTD37 TaxID=1778030 RepID=UPI0035BFE4FF
MQITPLGFWAVSSTGETTSFLVAGSDCNVLLDCGLNPARQLQILDIPLTTLGHIFISHVHSDHLSGFANLVFTRTVQERRYGKAQPLQVHGLPEVLATGRALLNAYYPEREFQVEWVPVADGESHDIGQKMQLTPFTVDHTVPTAGIVVSSEGRRLVGFTSDTALTEKLVADLHGVPLLIGECFGTEEEFGIPATQLKHLTAENLAVLATRTGADRLIPFHMQAPYAASEGRDRLMSTLRQGFQGEVIFPQQLHPVDCGRAS